MAKHLEKFTAPYQESRIPFLLAEPLTDGQGRMTDLIFRYVNAPGCALLNTSADSLTGKRFSRLFPTGQLAQLTPLQKVAFSGSSASFSYLTVLGSPVRVICYQPMYGLAACILDTSSVPESPDDSGDPTDHLPGVAAVLEVSRTGVRFLSFNRRLCDLTGREYRELLDFFADDLSALVLPEDWTDLLQALLDSVRSHQPIDHTFRVLRKDETTVWTNLRAELLEQQKGSTTFHALLLDVETQHRASSRQTEALFKTEAALSRYAALLNGLPGGYGLFQKNAQTLEPLYLSRGLSALLGYTVPELQAHLSEDPLWRIPAQDRTALLDQLAQGLPLRHLCRLRAKNDALLWVLLELAQQPQNDGSPLLLVSCTNVTAEKEAVSELEFHDKLCDLLLDDPQVISFDYDPAQDLCRIFRRDREGHRTTRTISGYLHDLEHSAIIHPEDQKHLAAAFKRASSHPTTDVVEYRGNYDQLGWRWYRVSWISLFDGKGDVYRLVGKAEDITRRRAAVQRFRELKARLKKADRALLASAQLDLAADRIVDARCPSRALTELLFGNTVSEFLVNVQAQIPTEAQQADFGSCFSRELLLSSFHQGHLHIRQEHRFSPGNGAAIWVETTAELIEDPDTRHTTAFCSIRNIDGLHRQSLLLHTLAARDYDLVLAVTVASGHCRSYGHASAEEASYRSFSVRYKELLGEKPPALEIVQANLEEVSCWTTPLPGGHPGSASWLWLDKTDQVLLLTIRDSGEHFLP